MAPTLSFCANFEIAIGVKCKLMVQLRIGTVRKKGWLSDADVLIRDHNRKILYFEVLPPTYSLSVVVNWAISVKCERAHSEFLSRTIGYNVCYQ